MRVVAGRLDVDAQASAVGEALEHVLRESRVVLELDHGGAAAAEIDGGARERVVHRHDGVAVARDALARAERAVERLAERDRRVLGGVMRPRLGVAAPLEHEVEPGVERELLEEVVVEAGAGRDAHAALAVEPEAHAQRGLRRRAHVTHASSRPVRRRRASAARIRSSSSRSRTVMRIASS